MAGFVSGEIIYRISMCQVQQLDVFGADRVEEAQGAMKVPTFVGLLTKPLEVSGGIHRSWHFLVLVENSDEVRISEGRNNAFKGSISIENQKPNLPSNKRKLEVTQDPNAVYKATKITAKGDVKRNGNARVENADENDGDDDDMEAGPALPPNEIEEAIDDEEGRFFGGGITSNTADVLNFIDERDKDDDAKAEKIDSTWVRKLALNFERRISKNSELRAKFEADPQKFMGSEADLDADIKALSILADHPDLYGEFVKLGCVTSLVSLLSHENTDIAIDCIEIINELTDEDVEAEQGQWDLLVDAMLEADLLNLLYDNIARLDEDNESDRAGVYHVLSVLENLSSRTTIAESLGRDTSILPWLLQRIQKKEPAISQNKQYAAEILAILLQSSSSNRTKFIDLDGVDIVLQLLSQYRRRDPAKGTEEEEYVENLFDSQTCCVDEPNGKTTFLEAEGIELCLIMLRQGKMSKPRALRLLDHALGGPDGAACCEKLVEAAGLKVVFGAFMKKHDSQATEHLLGILASMLRFLPANSAERIRFLAKFVEKEYEKIDRAMKIRREYASRVVAVDEEIRSEKAKLSAQAREDRADEWLSRRLDAGLYSLQTVDVILAWLVAEDSGAKKRIQGLLAERDESLDVIRTTLQDQMKSWDATAEDSDTVYQDILATLVEHLH
ncbi:MAG: hypothetical protein Q9211_003613 [Gyalolechia sp. 1 TL-2023]